MSEPGARSVYVSSFHGDETKNTLTDYEAAEKLFLFQRQLTSVMCANQGSNRSSMNAIMTSSGRYNSVSGPIGIGTVSNGSRSKDQMINLSPTESPTGVDQTFDFGRNRKSEKLSLIKSHEFKSG